MKQLKKDNNGVTGLYFNDIPLICPLTPPVLLPGQMAGTASVHQRHCNDLCPLFQTGNEIKEGMRTGIIDLYLCHVHLYVKNAPESAPKSSIITLSNENKAL